MVHSAGEWSWSSYRATTGLEHRPNYLTTDWILSAFGRKKGLTHPRVQAICFRWQKSTTALEKINQSNLSKACRQLSQIIEAARWIAPRKFLAVLSYLVAIARYCLSFAKKFSIRCLALYNSTSYSRGSFRLDFGGITASTPASSNTAQGVKYHIDGLYD